MIKGISMPLYKIIYASRMHADTHMHKLNTHTNIRTHAPQQTHTYRHTDTDTHPQMHTWMHARTCVYTHIHIYVCKQVHKTYIAINIAELAYLQHIW
jgi:hypothetical protein